MAQPKPVTSTEAQRVIAEMLRDLLVDAVPSRIAAALRSESDPERRLAVMQQQIAGVLTEAALALWSMARAAPEPARDVLEAWAAGLDPRRPS